MNREISKVPSNVREGIRRAQLPMPYEEAAQKLAEAVTIVEAMKFDSLADGMAFYAKVYKDKKVAVGAKKLKLLAYRKMGELAERERPTTYGVKHGGIASSGSPPGARSLLIEYGVTDSAAQQIIRVSKIPAEKMTELINSPNPPGIVRAGRFGSKSTATPSYQKFSWSSQGAMQFAVFCRNNPAVELATGMTKDEAKKAEAIATEIEEWLDTFKLHLPK